MGDVRLENLPDMLALANRAVRGFEARLDEVSFHWPYDDIAVEARFFYLRLRDGKPTTRDFVKYIAEQIIHFCIPYKERADVFQKMEEEKDFSYASALERKARDLFIQAKNSRKTTGELGELILFIILEAVLEAPQVASKMYLKTSQNMPVHGSDSVHLSYDADGDALVMHWGESKVYTNLRAAIKEIARSLKDFCGEGGTGSQAKERDVEIVRDHFALSSPEAERFREKVLEYFDPYSDLSNQLQERYACLACFDLPAYKKIIQAPKEDAKTNFITEYKSAIEKACIEFADEIKASKLDKLSFSFFLLPFESVAELRNMFYQEIGVTADD